MRFPLIVFAALIVFGCSSTERTPTGPSSDPQPAPSPPQGSLTSFWGLVIPDASDYCVTNARIEVVGGQRTGETFTQVTPCDVWDMGGGGVYIENLTPGVEMTLRASAPGYITKDFVITPIRPPFMATLLELSPTR